MPVGRESLSGLELDGLSSPLGADAQSRHRWYFLKESFSPDLVQTALEHESISGDDLVVDPFNGAGTVPLQCWKNGVRSVGIEVNPFLAFAARAKLLSYESSRFREHASTALAGLKGGLTSPLRGYSTFCRDKDSERGLFNAQVLDAFEGGWNAAKDIPTSPRPAIELALLGAAMDNCNAQRDGKALRYKKRLLDAGFGAESLAQSFEARVEQMADDLDEDRLTGRLARIKTGDSRRILARNDLPFRLCITSPPYLNSFDYSDLYRPELFLSKRVSSTEELRQIRLRTLRSHVQVKWPSPQRSAFGGHFVAFWKELRARKSRLWNPRIPSMIHAYFEDLKSVLQSLFRSGATPSSTWLVVSTSAYAGLEVPVDLILADIGVSAGWSLRQIRVIRSLRSSGQHWQRSQGADRLKPPLRESLIVFDKHE